MAPGSGDGLTLDGSFEEGAAMNPNEFYIGESSDLSSSPRSSLSHVCKMGDDACLSAYISSNGAVTFPVKFDPNGECSEINPITDCPGSPSRCFQVRHLEDNPARDVTTVVLFMEGSPWDDKGICEAVFSSLNMMLDVDGPCRLRGFIGQCSSELKVLVEDLRHYYESESESESDDAVL